MPTNSQGVPSNTGYIVAGGNLLTDFRSNTAAEGQSRLQGSASRGRTGVVLDPVALGVQG